MAEDEGSIFSNLPSLRGRRDDDDEDRRAQSRRWMNMRNANQEGPLRPRASGVGGPSIGQGPPPVATSVWSAADATANGMTLSNGGLTFSGGNGQTIRGTKGLAIGKAYVEFYVNQTGTSVLLGLASAGINVGIYLGQSSYSIGIGYNGNFVSPGFTGNYTRAGVPSVGDVWALAVDFTTGNFWLAQNNSWFSSSNPATGSLPIGSFVPATVGALFPALSPADTTEIWTLQPTAASQKYLPPPGYQAWDGGPVTPPASSVWSAADATANSVTLTNGGLTATYNGAVNLYVPVRSTVSKSAGKLYIEFLNVSPGNVDRYGFASASTNISVALGASNYSAGIGWSGNPISSGFTSHYAVALWANTGHVISLAIDFTAGNIWIALDGVWSGADPATGTASIISFIPATVGPLFPAIGWQQAGASYTLQPTAASQKYAPPAGFSPWG